MTELPSIPTIREDQLPAAYRASDRAAIDAQRTYLILVRINIVLILAGAATTSWAIQVAPARAALAVVGAIALGLGSLLTLAIKVTNYDKVWFGARAIAESIKTLVWRYMTRAHPFDPILDENQADELFCKEVAHILLERRTLGGFLARTEAADGQITDLMRKVRRESTALRKSLYLRERIKNQHTWYANKGKANRVSATTWLIAIALCQALAVVAAILLVRWPWFDLNFASILSALAVALLAWLQVKRHQDLSHSYGLAAHELGLIEALEKHILSDEDLSKFVGDAENAISREHTMWLARRDTLYPLRTYE